jgi:6-phosphogluconolactonase
MMEKIVKIFPSPDELAEKFAVEMAGMIDDSAKKNKPFTIVLSGGSTPELLFSLLGKKKYADSVPWQYVHLFWGDERCVSPDNADSNFGMTSRTLLGKIDIPSNNIHRIRGEEDPEKEVYRYSDEISLYISKRDGIPRFDLVVLGLGEDGHTASIFPGHQELLDSDKICEVACHPLSKQKRITLTGRVINNADKIAFLVTGKKKMEIVEKILKNEQTALNYPAYYIVPSYGQLYWYIDKDAAGSL